MEEKLARGLLLLINCEGEADPGGGRDIQGVFFSISGAREIYRGFFSNFRGGGDIQGVFFPISGAREIYKRVACSFSAGLDWVELVSRLKLNNKYMLIDCNACTSLSKGQGYSVFIPFCDF